jgi:flagellar basal-body rod modification protein FlgD
MNMSGITTSGYMGSQVNSPSNTMGKDAFLELLVTQLANQDPLNPQDSQAFAAQLADFSSLEQLSQINTNLESGLQADQQLAGALQSSMAAGMIGRTVIAVDNRVRLEDGSATLAWESTETPASLSVEIYGNLGQLISSRSVEVQENQRWQWDGKDAQGNSLPDAEYQLRFVAEDSSGASITVRSLLEGPVATVRYRNGEAWLLVNGVEVDLGSIAEIRETTPTDDGQTNTDTDPANNGTNNW